MDSSQVKALGFGGSLLSPGPGKGWKGGMDLCDSTRLQVMILGLHFAAPVVRWSETARLEKSSWVSLKIFYCFLSLRGGKDIVQ